LIDSSTELIFSELVIIEDIIWIRIHVSKTKLILNLIFEKEHLFYHSISIDWSSANWTQQGAAGGLEVLYKV
jgi:hypothetical protein